MEDSVTAMFCPNQGRFKMGKDEHVKAGILFLERCQEKHTSPQENEISFIGNKEKRIPLFNYNKSYHKFKQRRRSMPSTSEELIMHSMSSCYALLGNSELRAHRRGATWEENPMERAGLKHLVARHMQMVVLDSLFL